jgi:hypothetical protein
MPYLPAIYLYALIALAILIVAGGSDSSGGIVSVLIARMLSDSIAKEGYLTRHAGALLSILTRLQR